MNAKREKKLTSNMEDYLEAIAVLKKKNGVARVKDISRLLSVRAPSVTSALSNLSDKGLVEHERYGFVELTREGGKAARDVQRRHNVLFSFLTEILNIDPKIAVEDACKMEHSVSPQTLEKLEKFIEFVEKSPYQDKPEWLEGFDYYFKTGKRRKCAARKGKQ